MATSPGDDGGGVSPGPYEDDFFEDDLEAEDDLRSEDVFFIDDLEAEDDPRSEDVFFKDDTESEYDLEPAHSLEAKDDPKAVPKDTHSGIKKELAEALDYVQPAGTFASQGELPFIDPQIKVNKVGTICLPLQESQARQLMEQAHQAPYGKGSETLVDTAVRNTLELNPHQFELVNPDWDNYVRQACTGVARDLGVDAPVSAELYKMLIYEKGAMFKPHTDTEKAPGMFATLVIGLPSPFEGGDVVVRHQGQKMILTTLKHGFSYVSWYSDVIHEVLPVRSGYRWVLIYNLCVDPSRVSPTACLQTDEAQKVYRTLKAWLNKDSQADEILSHAYYRLDHEYTQANISLNALKGRDMATVHLLKGVSKDLNLHIFLAVITKTQHGSCAYEGRYKRRPYRFYHDDDDDEEEDYYRRPEPVHTLKDVSETFYEIDMLVDLDGRQVMKNISLDRDNVLQKRCFNVEPEEDYTEYQGNWGPEAPHWYRVAAVVMVPRDSITQFLNNSWQGWLSPTSRENRTSIIGYLAKSVLKTPGDQFMVDSLKDLCQKVGIVSDPELPEVSHPPKIDLPEAVITEVLQAAIVLKDQDFIESALNHHEGNLSLRFFAWAKEHVANDAIAFNSLKEILLRAILGFPVLWKRQVAVKNFVPPTKYMSDALRLWIRRVHNKVLELIPQQDLGREDGQAVIDMIPGYHDFGYLSSRVVPQVEARLAATSFILAFLSRLDQHTTEGVFPTEDAKNLYKRVAKSLVDKIDISTLGSEDADGHRRAMVPNLGLLWLGLEEEPEPAPLPRCLVVTPQLLAKFISTLSRITPDGDHMMGVLSRRICSHAPAIEAPKFHSLWLPFLHALIKACEANLILTSTPAYQQIFAAILKAYINNYVGDMPPDDNFVRPTLSACCNDCSSLNDFLRDPNRTVGRFAVNTQRQHHLHDRLDRARIDCSHVTKRTGSSQTLVVTKTFHHRERHVMAWKDRKKEGAAKLLKLSKRDLSVWFGEDYDKFMGMVGLGPPSTRRQARKALPPPQPQSLASILPSQQTQQRFPRSSSMLSGHERLNNASSRKRTAAEMDVVDLTGGD